MSRSPHGIEPDLAAASRRVPRPKARLADSRRAGCAGRAAACRNDLVLDRLGLKVKEAQELTRFRVQCDPRTFAEKAKSDVIRCLRDRHKVFSFETVLGRMSAEDAQYYIRDGWTKLAEWTTEDGV
jgi:hypothetical protein